MPWGYCYSGVKSFSDRPSRFLLPAAMPVAEAPSSAAGASNSETSRSFQASSPWGVPAFFVGTGSRGDLGWSHFGETRGQVDVTFGANDRVDLYAGAEITRQQVRTFQRALGYLPVGDSVPPVALSNFSPASSAGYFEAQLRLADLAFTGGVRYDQFSAGSELAGASASARFDLAGSLTIVLPFPKKAGDSPRPPHVNAIGGPIGTTTN